RTPHLRGLSLRRIAETELTLTGTAVHGRMLHLGLALQHPHDLRHDGQDLPHDLVHVFRTQLPRRLAVSRIAHSCERSLSLRENLRQRRYQLPHDLAHILLRKLALLAAPLRLTRAHLP